MLLTYLMLGVALCLSAIAAFYSIIGLTAIFAAAVMPVVVMGSILEVAKIVVTVWLHEYWHRCKRAMKIYLVPAVAILMLITSMGIFGFLSKAHLDQAVPAGDVSAQVAIFDDKIKTQRDNIEAARAALKQLDAAVDQQMARSTDEQGAQRAATLRRQQGAERNRLNQDISRAQTEIVKLQEQRAPLAAEARKVEAEVGPIKYIAALIYGDNPDTNLLEKAVRWVIIILVIVFDPLAIFMLLAATESYKWEKYGRRGDPEEQEPAPEKPVLDTFRDLQERWNQWRKPNAVDNDDADTTPSVDERPAGDRLDDKPVAEMVGQPKPRLVEYQILDEAEDADSYVVRGPIQKTTIDDIPDNTVPEIKLMDGGYVNYRGKVYSPQAFEALFPDVEYPSGMTPVQSGFGTKFPENPTKGDIFLRVDYLPTKLFRWNGIKWIETNKSLTDSYAHQDSYIEYLIGKISSGEYDPELLTQTERDLIAQRLKNDPEPFEGNQ